jgi:HPt (histidine-containing phosphotransfer) domain-containing protein
MERVATAFDTSAARLLPQLLAAQAAGDAEGIRHVAHTLKSSAASVGAVKLSRMCAEMEQQAKQGQVDGTNESISALSTELAAVLAVLKLALVSSP